MPRAEQIAKPAEWDSHNGDPARPVLLCVAPTTVTLAARANHRRGVQHCGIIHNPQPEEVYIA